jgi:methionyl aminopeptidase
MTVALKTPAQIRAMRAAGQVAAQVRQEIRAAVRPGVTTGELDRLAEARIRALGGTPGFKGLYGFPASICTSVNSEVVHGVPGRRVLLDGDLLKVDVGVVRKGYCADTAFTIAVGRPNVVGAKLVEAAEQALLDAIASCVPGARLGDVGAAVERRAGLAGFRVVRDYGGHGIGRQMHEVPWVANFGVPGTGDELRPGMVLALEPMLNVGSSEVKTVDLDGWQVVVTADGTLSAHFEDTVAVAESGPEVLTRGGA